MCGIHVCLEVVNHFNVTPDCVTASSPLTLERERLELRKQIAAANLALCRRGIDSCGKISQCVNADISVTFCSSILQIRGRQKTVVPLHKSSSRNILAFNGEIYAHGDQCIVGSDSRWLLDQLEALEGDSVGIIRLFSTLRGPWCIVYWHHETRRLWIAKDVIGRRSLLLRLPTSRNQALTISSVASTPHEGTWIDCPPGIYSYDSASLLYYSVQRSSHSLVNHAWSDEVTKTLFTFRRGTVSLLQNADNRMSQVPTYKISGILHSCFFQSMLWRSLDRAVDSRVLQQSRYTMGGSCTDAHFGVLFSGGLDCTVLCTLLHKHLRTCETIELFNVCFNEGRSPDRQAALSAFRELKLVCVGRNWRLIEVNVSGAELSSMKQYIESLIRPSKSSMDFNIAAALWFAARGIGMVDLGTELVPFYSKIRVLVSGQGADELFAGYSRHRTVFLSFGQEALSECLRNDFLRIWRRNLSRDDRIFSDHGREVRFPYLDEEVVQVILRSPLDKIADLSLEKGVGDKKCLRELALHLGLPGTGTKVKRAIQFGSRIRRFETQYG